MVHIKTIQGKFKNLILGKWSILYIPLVLGSWLAIELWLLMVFNIKIPEPGNTSAIPNLNLFNIVLTIRSIIMVLIIILLVRRVLHEPMGKIGLKTKQLNFFIFYGFVCAIPISIVAYIINLLMILIQGYPSEVNPVVTLLMKNKEGAWFLTILGTLIIPFHEEIVFRGFIYTLLRQSFNKYISMIVVSIIFTFLHMIPANFPAIFFLSIMLCILYEITSSLVSSITCHAVFNGISFLLLNIFTS